MCKMTLLDENRLEDHYHHYHPISINEERLLDRILHPACWDCLEPSWFDYSRCTLMAITKLTVNNLPMDNVPGAPPPEDTSAKDPIDPEQRAFTCTSDPTRRNVLVR